MKLSENKNLYIKIITAILFLFSVFCCMYYIWSNFFILETNTDVLDNVIWAQATAESGKLINPDYIYPYYIPLGGHLLMVPFVKIFGLGIFAARAGMTIFTVIMTIAMVLFFKTFLERWDMSFLVAGTMLLSLLGTEKIREIFFGHVLHYSLSILLWMISIVIIHYFDTYKNSNVKKTKITIGILFIHFFICGIEGMTVILFSAIPMIGFVILKYLFSNKKIKEYNYWDKIAVFWCALGLILGFLVYKWITYGKVATYADQYMEYDLYKNWVENISVFFAQWVSLFMDMFSYNEVYVEILSKNGIMYIVKIAMMLMTLFLFIASVFVYGKVKKEIEKKILLSSWVLAAATIYFYVFGKIGIHSWRMLPFWFGSIVVSIIVIKNVLKNETFIRIKKLAIIGILVLLCNSMINGILTLKRNVDVNVTWFGDNTMIDILRENNLSEGYVLDYWMGNSITVLTNEEMKVRNVALSSEADLIYERLQNNLNWYNNDSNPERTFLIVPDYMLSYYVDYFEVSEEMFQANIVDRAVEIYEGSQFYYRDKSMVDFTIYVFDREDITVLEGIPGM